MTMNRQNKKIGALIKRLEFVEKFQIICKSKCDDVIRLLRIIYMYIGMFIKRDCNVFRFYPSSTMAK